MASKRSTSKKKRPQTKSAAAVATAAKKLNKSAWIRSQPPEMSASEVVRKAKAEGIKLSPAQVYTARSTAKTKSNGRTAAATRKALQVGRPAGHEAQFRRAVLHLGLDRAEALLASLKSEFGV